MSHFPFRYFIFTLAVGSLAHTAFAETPATSDSLRQIVNINPEWRFFRGDQPGAEAVELDDAKWEAVNLPHSFSLPYFQAKDYYVGVGWYRKDFEIDPAWMKKRVYIEFDGAYREAEVYVNGAHVGRHAGGYTGFSVDITDTIHLGKNVLAIRLSNQWNARLTPRGGDHNFSGGIYRDVRLVATDPLHVSWYGTFVTTPMASKESATVNVKTEIQNQGTEARNTTVETSILDPDGKEAARFSSSQAVAPGATVTFDQTCTPIPEPKLWAPSHPFLYTAATTVRDGSRTCDVYRTPFGIRWFEFTADKGFFLNGEHYYFHGANVHQDHAGWANAVTDNGSRRDVKFTKDAGLDFIRGSHYPHSPAFSCACDDLGVLFWSENCFWGSGGGTANQDYLGSGAYPPKIEYQQEFEQSVRDGLREMIRIHRNHPSIVVWSMCNEVFFTDKSTLPRVRDFLKELVAYSHELDPTRPAAIGGAQRGDIDKIGDIAGYNGDGARLKEYQDPGVPSVVSEYGSVTSVRPNNYDGQFKKDELQADTPQYPWRSGQVVWCGFDYGTVFGSYAGSKGLVDYFRIPKRSWYWYRNEFLKIPPPAWPALGTPDKLDITADKSIIIGTDATDDCQLLVTVKDATGTALSNSPPVTLSIESGPGEFPTGRTITFAPDSDIAIRDGTAAIEFRSYQGGPAIIRATSPGLKDATITITTQGSPTFVPGKTPVVADRTYVQQPRKSIPFGPRIDNCGLNRPTNASSEALGHNSSLGLDGDPATYWSPIDSSSGAWWQANLEHPFFIDTVETTFAVEGTFHYRLECSIDGIAWSPLFDLSADARTSRTRTDKLPKPVHCQFIRINFIDVPVGQSASVSEMKISGKEAF